MQACYCISFNRKYIGTTLRQPFTHSLQVSAITVIGWLDVVENISVISIKYGNSGYMQDPRGGKVARMLFKVFLGQVKCVLIFEFVLFFCGGGRGSKKI